MKSKAFIVTANAFPGSAYQELMRALGAPRLQSRAGQPGRASRGRGFEIFVHEPCPLPRFGDAPVRWELRTTWPGNINELGLMKLGDIVDGIRHFLKAECLVHTEPKPETDPHGTP